MKKVPELELLYVKSNLQVLRNSTGHLKTWHGKLGIGIGIEKDSLMKNLADLGGSFKKKLLEKVLKMKNKSPKKAITRGIQV